MFPFDAPAETTLALLIPVILILYAFFLLRLKPEKEKEAFQTKLPTRTSKAMVEAQTGKSPTERVEVRKVPGVEPTPASQIQMNSDVRAGLTPASKDQPVTKSPTFEQEAHTLIARISQQESGASTSARDVQDAQKKPSSQMDIDFAGCRHYLGHLSKLPKSMPIPNECFGCPDTLQCIRHANKKRW